MLEVRELVVRYGTATALDGVDLDVAAGEMVALVGANGAGKSTLVNTLSGIVRPAAGTVRLDGRMAQVPEGRQLFATLTVEDNLRLGAWRNTRARRDPARIYDLFPDLVRLRQQLAGSLSGGQQQMVAVGRALMADPDLLAVDELSLGLAPLVVRDLAAHLAELNRDRGLAVLLIEQETTLAFELCTRGYVLEAGRVVASGPSADLQASPEVAAAYLGGLPG
ncbi:ABC transporter ATP-binding protein [Cryptosporangium sp. NPDC048952]|uniref:ABC transporter ATP-binding protein n=1 Tax=Cryptosporangium sp. NPDC048952 TaxID=3363961 RepID=UPI0037208CB1